MAKARGRKKTKRRKQPTVPQEDEFRPFKKRARKEPSVTFNGPVYVLQFVESALMAKNVFHGDVGNVADKIDNATTNIVKSTSPLDGIDLLKLADQLDELRRALRKEASSDDGDHDEAIGQVATAAKAAKNGDASKVTEALKDAGKWVLGVAEKIGVELAVSTLKSTMGIPPA